MKWYRRDSERTRGRIIRVVKMKKEREEKRKKEKRGEEIEIWEGINRKERMLCHAMTRCSIVHYTRTYAQIYMYIHTYIHTYITTNPPTHHTQQIIYQKYFLQFTRHALLNFLAVHSFNVYRNAFFNGLILKSNGYNKIK